MIDNSTFENQTETLTEVVARDGIGGIGVALICTGVVAAVGAVYYVVNKVRNKKEEVVEVVEDDNN